MITIDPYLNFNGNTEEAFNFYKNVLGGDFSNVSRFNEMPPQEEKPVSKEEGEKLMHIALPISKETMLMGSDTGGEWAANYQQGNNFSVSLNTDSKEEADRLFNGLSKGGNATMPMADTFWGDYFGMLTDRFGINWMISYHAPENS